MATDLIAFPEDFPVRMIGLREVTFDPEIQSRLKTDIEHARKITEFVLKNGPINEPIVVFDDGRRLWGADGYHRHKGYSEAARVQPRFKQIRAEIRPGTRRDAMIYSAGANQDKTYLKRKPGDIRNAILMLLKDEECTKWTHSKIASHVGCSSDFSKKTFREWRISNQLAPRANLSNDAYDGPMMVKQKHYKSKANYHGKPHPPFVVNPIGGVESFIDWLELNGFMSRETMWKGSTITFESGVCALWKEPSDRQFIGCLASLIMSPESSPRRVIIKRPEFDHSCFLDLINRFGVEVLDKTQFLASLKADGEPSPEANDPHAGASSPGVQE
jgi:hypothetical protein